MKKSFIVVFIVFLFATAGFSQTVLVEKKKVHDLDQKISECQAKISRLEKSAGAKDISSELKVVQAEIDTLNLLSPTTEYGKGMKTKSLKEKSEKLAKLQKQQDKFNLSALESNAEKATLEAQLKQYESEKSKIFEAYIADNSAPKELSPRELKRRVRGNYNRREDLVFKKLESNPIYGDKTGFEGIICNKYPVSVMFRFTPLDGGESKSLLVGSGKTIREKLVPGLYRVNFYDGGREIGNPCIFASNTVINNFDGTPCHWFVYMPRF